MVRTIVLGLVLAVTACSGMLQAPCQRACSDRQTTEPSDYNDCIKRCQR